MIRKKLLLSVLILLTPLCMQGISLTSIDFTSSDTTWVMGIKLTGSANYRYFYLEDRRPLMFVLDIENTINGLTQRRFKIRDAFPILRVRNSQFKLKPFPVARVVVDMSQKVPVSIEVKENKILATFKRRAIRGMVSEGISTSGVEVEASAVYRSLGKKDPFSEPKLGLEEENLPDVIDATLSGIVAKEDGVKYAIIKDRDGKGWVIREGGRVKGGRLIRIGNNFATFLIRELGVLKRVELTMETEKGKKGKRAVPTRRR